MNEQYIERYWRDAEPADAIKEPPMVARFQDNWESDEDWVIGKLIYWDRSRVPWNSETWDRFERCQVYDAPDPGEGWRLIDTEKETPKNGDEFLLTPRNEWIAIAGDPSRGFCGRGFAEGYVYRRRIEQPKPQPRYEPFEWEDREQLRGRWIIQVGDENAEQMINKMDFAHNEFYANNKSARQLLNDWHFRDTGEPVGKRVQ